MFLLIEYATPSLKLNIASVTSHLFLVEEGELHQSWALAGMCADYSNIMNIVTV